MSKLEGGEETSGLEEPMEELSFAKRKLLSARAQGAAIKDVKEEVKKVETKEMMQKVSSKLVGNAIASVIQEIQLNTPRR